MIRSLCTRRAAPHWSRGATTFRPRQGKLIPSSAFATQSRSHCRESYSTKLRYEARASISFGDNLFAMRGMGSAAA